MLVDSFEPVNIEAALRQSLPEVIRTELNRSGMADYVWNTFDSQQEQAERKQVPEILSNLEHVEYQLGQELQGNAHTILLIEGIAEPCKDGIQTYMLTDNQQYFRRGRIFTIPYARYEGWLVSLEQVGLLVWKTSSWYGTVQALVRFEKSAQVPDHSILNRHLKLKPDWHPNKQVQTLMGIADGGIGPVLAEALIEAFGDVWTVLNQTTDGLAISVPALGKARASKLLKAVGWKV